MRLVVRLVTVVLVILLIPAQLGAVGPLTQVKECENCSDDGYGGAACGPAAQWGEPSNWICKGGVICYPGGDGNQMCFPDCGRRCYSA